ncbi:MAG: hypothetical protein S4CHLAM102_10880 [Chlamydiia bacterium]|nr:hypothetical protein [Chlamydiia bacterium]
MDLESIWQSLKGIQRVEFFSRASSCNTGWDGVGAGLVEVEDFGDSIIFHERGRWEQRGGRQMDFSNQFFWSINWKESSIRLEHWRRGKANRVYLFDLVVEGERLVSSRPHLCGADRYSGSVRWVGEEMVFCWQIEGPKKDVNIEYRYS